MNLQINWTTAFAKLQKPKVRVRFRRPRPRRAPQPRAEAVVWQAVETCRPVTVEEYNRYRLWEIYQDGYKAKAT